MGIFGSKENGKCKIPMKIKWKVLADALHNCNYKWTYEKSLWAYFTLADALHNCTFGEVYWIKCKIPMKIKWKFFLHVSAKGSLAELVRWSE
jgi:hypothetical protein